MTRPGHRRAVKRRQRTRPITTPDPVYLAQQDAVVMGRPENPYPPDRPAHHLYEQAYQRARASLPEDWQPEYPRRLKRRQNVKPP